MYASDFYNDRLQNFDSVDRTDVDKNIANRNTVLAYSANAITALSIFSNVVNDVHGAVMYGSSITQTNGGPLNGRAGISRSNGPRFTLRLPNNRYSGSAR